MQLPGGGGQPWLQPNCILRLAIYWEKLLQALVFVSLINFFIRVVIVPQMFQMCLKVLQCNFQGVGGQPWLQPNCILRPAIF